MKNRLRALFALALLLPLILILTLQTTATPRAEDDQGIEQRRDRERDKDEDNERQRRDRDDDKEDERRRDRDEVDDEEDERRRDRDENEDDDDERIDYYRKAEAELKELVEAGKISRRQAQERLVGLRKKLWSHDEDDEDDDEEDRRRRDRDEDDDERRWLSPRTEEKILDALDDETVMEFADVPLKQMVDQIVNRHKIPVWIDEQALDENGLGTDTAVNQNLRGISLRSGLNLTLGSLRLTYVIKDEVLKITTPEQAEAELISRIYPLGDLILPRDEYEASFTTRIGAAVAAGRISREEAGKIFERHDRQEKHPQRNLHGDEQDREEHLQAAIEHLQGAGVSARTARHVIAEAMRLKDKGDDHHKVEHRRHAEEDEQQHHEREGDEDEEFHYRAHHETATQLETLRREVEELRQLIKRMAARR